MPLVPTREGMNEVFLKAKEANREEDPFEPSLFDYPTTAATLCKLLVSKISFNLVPEFSQLGSRQRV